MSSFPNYHSSEFCSGIKTSLWGWGIVKLEDYIPRSVTWRSLCESPEFNSKHHTLGPSVTPEIETEGVQGHSCIASSKAAWATWIVTNRELLCDVDSSPTPWLCFFLCPRYQAHSSPIARNPELFFPQMKLLHFRIWSVFSTLLSTLKIASSPLELLKLQI